jgi:hypothetical protein
MCEVTVGPDAQILDRKDSPVTDADPETRSSRPAIGLLEAPPAAVTGGHRYRDPVTRRKPRRKLVLFAAAGFVFALAAALPTYVYPRLTALPADPQREQVLEATGATVLLPDLKSPAGARVRRGLDVQTRTFVSAAEQSLGDSVVWNVATRTLVSGHGLLDARVETVSLDPRTGQPTNCCGDRLRTTEADPDGEPLIHSGLFAFPLNAQKRDYPMWDIQLRRARAAQFVAAETRHGIRTYRFDLITPLTGIGSMELPGRLFGENTPSVTAISEYASTRTFWIEPNTSQVLDLRDKVTQQFRYGDRVVPAMSAVFTSPPPSQQVLSEARQGARVLPWLRGRASIVLVALGIGLLFIATRRPRPVV